jgi:tungstate transport system ATP-binding protein
MAEAGALDMRRVGAGTRKDPERSTTAGCAAAPLIALEGVALCYGTHAALRDIDLRIAPGERVAFVGANGSGKSTLLRVLHGLLPPSAGARRVSLSGGGRPLRFAMLFQRPFLLRLSSQANLRLALWLGGWRGVAAHERCRLALQRVGLATEARRPARALSGGQQQRLALARAWALQPDVLLLDEPTASLDPSAKREVEQLLAEFAEQGTTLLMASHNLGQVKRLAQRVVYLEHGRILADASLTEFFDGAVAPEARLFLKGELPW